MKLLNVKANMHPVWGGGTAERTFQMSRALAQFPGVETALLCLDLGLASDWHRKLAGVEVVALPCLSRRFQLPAAAPGTIRRAVARADVIHLMGHWTLLNALVYRQARRLGKPYVVCSAGTLVSYGRSRLLKRGYQALVGNGIIRHAARHIAITADERDRLVALGVDPARVQVIPNGIRLADYQHRDDAGVRRTLGLGDQPFVLFVGRLNPIKGPDLLVEAFARVADRFPDHQLVLAGPDEGLGPRLSELSRQQGLASRVRLVGYIAGDDKSAAYHAAELLVIPSRHEAMSIVVLESGAAGTPVVATDRCGLDDLVGHGGGWLTPATVDGLADALAEALSDPDQRAARGAALLAATRRDFSWDAIGSRHVELFRQALEERHR
jgi:glycosyltransferase involved in cell wall biosynthesis